MFLVGLTGGIACGKSTVAAMLIDLGCSIIDADVVARQVVEPGEIAYREIVRHFGEEVLHPDGTLNRERLGEIVFSDQQQRKKLNSITHPQIYKSMVKQVLWKAVTGHQFVILDLPLLFETAAMLPYLTYTVVVHCDAPVQLHRLQTRNQYTEEEALQRINAQMPLEQKCRLSTHVIYNSMSVDATHEQVVRLYEQLRASKAHWKLRACIGLGLVTILGGVAVITRGLWEGIKWSMY